MEVLKGHEQRVFSGYPECGSQILPGLGKIYKSDKDKGNNQHRTAYHHKLADDAFSLYGDAHIKKQDKSQGRPDPARSV